LELSLQDLKETFPYYRGFFAGKAFRQSIFSFIFVLSGAKLAWNPFDNGRLSL